MSIPIITKKEADRILNAVTSHFKISLDLGISLTNVRVDEDFVYIGHDRIPTSEFKDIDSKSCYILENSELKEIIYFFERTKLYYKLIQTKDWPIFTMSQTTVSPKISISPKEETTSKIKEIVPIEGKVLDTRCGLGYIPIMAATKADMVCTFEKDSYVLNLAKLNPFSQELFNNKKIVLYKEDVYDGIDGFRDLSFDRIIHDPQTFEQSPELYSKEFHEKLYCVLKKGGVLYHHCPWPKKTRGEGFYKKIIANLTEIGFKRVIYNDNTSGIRAIKQ